MDHHSELKSSQRFVFFLLHPSHCCKPASSLVKPKGYSSREVNGEICPTPPQSLRFDLQTWRKNYRSAEI